MILPEQDLRSLASDLLVQHGVPSKAATIRASVLVEAELRGLPSHGLQCLPPLPSRLRKGLAHPAATGRHTWRRSGLLDVDGQRGSGPVVMMTALDALMAGVGRMGIAVAAVRNANHIGMLAYYAEKAVDRGLVGLILCTTEELMPPLGGTSRILWANPMAIGIPTGREPFVLDLAMSRVFPGCIHGSAVRAEPLEEGSALGAEGRPTRGAEAAKISALPPFGGAKGYGVGPAAALLAALLAGSELASEVRGTLDDSHVADKGNLLLLIEPGGSAAQRCGLAEYLDLVRASRSAEPGRALTMPENGMRAPRAAALCRGIDLPDALMNQLTEVRAATA